MTSNPAAILFVHPSSPGRHGLETGRWLESSNLAVVFVPRGQPAKRAAALQLILWLVQGVVVQRRRQLSSGSHGFAEQLQSSGQMCWTADFDCKVLPEQTRGTGACSVLFPPFGKISLIVNIAQRCWAYRSSVMYLFLGDISSDQY